MKEEEKEIVITPNARDGSEGFMEETRRGAAKTNEKTKQKLHNETPACEGMKHQVIGKGKKKPKTLSQSPCEASQRWTHTVEWIILHILRPFKNMKKLKGSIR